MTIKGSNEYQMALLSLNIGFQLGS